MLKFHTNDQPLRGGMMDTTILEVEGGTYNCFPVPQSMLDFSPASGVICWDNWEQISNILEKATF